MEKGKWTLLERSGFTSYGGLVSLNNPFANSWRKGYQDDGRFFILQEAMSDDNLCRMYIGWAPFL